ncbi:MAG TPA: hypothetical protein VFZ59_19620 [Verrucomicrobiae bacterium]|nr:hypothetical protein [Verrucomicrobiae bacterium]
MNPPPVELVAAMGALPNAWQIVDDSNVRGGLLGYTNRLTLERHRT